MEEKHFLTRSVTFPHDLNTGLLHVRRLNLSRPSFPLVSAVLQDRLQRFCRLPLGHLIGGCFIRVVVPAVLLQISQYELPQRFDCRHTKTRRKVLEFLSHQKSKAKLISQYFHFLLTVLQGCLCQTGSFSFRLVWRWAGWQDNVAGWMSPYGLWLICQGVVCKFAQNISKSLCCDKATKMEFCRRFNISFMMVVITCILITAGWDWRHAA